MPLKTCRLCTPESSKNLILLSICYSITFTLAWVIVSLFKYYAYFSCNYQFSASPYVIETALGLLLSSVKYKKNSFSPMKISRCIRSDSVHSGKYGFPVRNTRLVYKGGCANV